MALWPNHIVRVLAGWACELAVTIYRGREVTGLTQDGTGVGVALSGGGSMRTENLVGCDGGGRFVRRAAGLDLPGSHTSASWLIAEVERNVEPVIGTRPEGRDRSRRPAPRRRTVPRRPAGRMSGLEIRYDLGDGHPLLGRRVPDLDLVTVDGFRRLYTLLHRARPVLLDLGQPARLEITSWPGRVRVVDARYRRGWERPVRGRGPAPAAVLIRPDGYVVWVGDGTDTGLHEALTTWFGSPRGHVVFAIAEFGPVEA